MHYQSHVSLYSCMMVVYLLQPITHLVLSDLYRKMLLKVEDVSMMIENDYEPHDVVFVQCTKSPEVVAATADVLNALTSTEEATLLRGL